MRYERWIIACVVLTFIAVAFAFSRGPLLEGPNEVEHYRFIRLVAQQGTLPDRAGHPYGQLHQAPLYYILGVPILKGADDALFDDLSERLNPYHAHEFAQAGSDNKNVHLHLSTDAESGFARALLTLRLYSILLGLLTVLISYNSLTLLFPNQPHLYVMGLAVVALTPQFVYMSSVVNNDNLLFLGIAASFNLAIRQAINGPSYRNAVLLGVALGVALLAKSLAGMLALPMAAAVLLDRRTWFWYAPVTLVTVALVAGWWYVGNYLQYGEFTGMGAMFQTWPTEIIRENEIALDVGLQRAPYGYMSFWARFGHGAVAMGQEVYLFFNVISALSGAGLLLWAAKHIRRGIRDGRIDWSMWRLAIIVGTFTLVWVVALIYSSSTVLSGNQGRYLIPGFVGWAVFIAIGLDQWLPRRIKQPAAILFALLMAGVLVYSYARYFVPAYQVQTVTAQTNLEPLYIYENSIALLDISPTLLTGQPGDLVAVTLTWQALKSVDRDLLTYIHSVDTAIVRRSTYPGTGNLLAANWRPGDVWRETHYLRIPHDATPQQIHPLIAGYYDIRAEQPLAVDNQSATPFIGYLVVQGQAASLVADYQLGAQIAMQNPSIQRNEIGLELCFAWQALENMADSYHVFVHLLDAEGEVVDQIDFPPQNGRYPSWAWGVGEVVETCRLLPSDTDAVQLATGMYELTNLQRLPLATRDGQRQQHDMLVLTLP